MAKNHKAVVAGFTIMELLVVIVILGVLAGMAGPAVSRIVRHQRVNRAAMVITADLPILAQRQPGEPLHFEVTTLAVAQAALRTVPGGRVT